MTDTAVNPLPDLSAVVAAQFATLATNGTIALMIEKHLTEAINGIIKSEMREYSDFGKALKEKVTGALQVADLKDMPSYTHLVAGIVRRHVEAEMNGKISEVIAANIEKAFAHPPAEITIHELVERFKEHVKEQSWRATPYEMGIRVKEWDSGGFVVEISRDPSESNRHDRSDVYFQVNKDGEIFALRLGETEMSKTLFSESLSPFERLLFSMYVNGSKLLIDSGTTEHDFDLEYSNYD